MLDLRKYFQNPFLTSASWFFRLSSFWKMKVARNEFALRTMKLSCFSDEESFWTFLTKALLLHPKRNLIFFEVRIAWRVFAWDALHDASDVLIFQNVTNCPQLLGDVSHECKNFLFARTGLSSCPWSHDPHERLVQWDAYVFWTSSLPLSSSPDS